MKRFITFLFVGLVAKGATINSVSCNYPDVTNAVAHANFGDTVVLPNGSGKWWNTVNISGITLVGQGTNNTIITDETPVQNGGYTAGIPILTASITNASLTRVTGIQFTFGVTNNLSSYPGRYGEEVIITGPSPRWQIDNCSFVLLSGKVIGVLDDSFGVVSHCYFNTQSTIALEVYGNGFGDIDWATNTTYGSTNSVYFESNFQHDNFSFGWVDVSQGGRLVYRNNYTEGCYVNTHGAETTQRYRSSRWIEVYNNIFTNYPIGNFNNMATAIDIRGGGALVFSNTAYGYNFLTDIEYYRATDNDPGFTPWFGMTGISGWDNNGVLIDSGTALVSSNKLVTSSSLPLSLYRGCTVFNVNKQLCGVVSSNTTNTYSFVTSRNPTYQITFTVGDNYQVRRPYFGIDQPGAGQSDLLTNLFSPTPVYLNFKTNVICNWSNKLFQTQNNQRVQISANAVTPYPNLIEGRDYTNSTAINYSPLPYPYPYLVTNNPLSPPIISAPSSKLLGNIGNISHMH